MRAEGANTAIVVSKGKPPASGSIAGVITREQVADLAQESMAFYEK